MKKRKSEWGFRLKGERAAVKGHSGRLPEPGVLRRGLGNPQGCVLQTCREATEGGGREAGSLRRPQGLHTRSPPPP